MNYNDDDDYHMINFTHLKNEGSLHGNFSRDYENWNRKKWKSSMLRKERDFYVTLAKKQYSLLNHKFLIFIPIPFASINKIIINDIFQLFQSFANLRYDDNLINC